MTTDQKRPNCINAVGQVADALAELSEATKRCKNKEQKQRALDGALSITENVRKILRG